MADFRLYLKEKNSEKETQIRLHIHYRNKIAKIYIGEKLHPIYWNPTLQRAKQTKKFPEFPEFNERLEDAILAGKRALKNLLKENDGIYPEPNVLSKRVKIELGLEKGKPAMNIYDYFDKRIKEEEIRLKAKGITPDRSSYPKSLKRTKELLKEYERSTGNKISFEQITLEFYYDFITYMQTVKGYKVNSMGKYIKYIKSIMKISHAEGLHNNKAYSHPKFKILEESVDTVYLDVDDLNLLESLDLNGFPGLERARDLFLIASWTGLRFSDLQSLNIDNIQGDNIVIMTQKTEKEVVIPVFPIVKKILDKYKDSGLPIITNQALNRSLKDLGAKLEKASKLKGITKTVSKYGKITTHTARRSFATNLYHTVPIELIMSVTGHKTQSEFYKYIRITPKENADKIRQYFPSLFNSDAVGTT